MALYVATVWSCAVIGWTVAGLLLWDATEEAVEAALSYLRYKSTGGVRAGGGKMQPVMAALASTQSICEHEIAQTLAALIGERQYDHWFRQQTRLHPQADELVVSVANPFLLKWLQKRFHGELAQTAAALLGPSATVRLEVDPTLGFAAAQAPANVYPTAMKTDLVPEYARPVATEQSRTSQHVEAVKSVAPQPPPPAVPRPGRKFADLADFVAGACNELPLAAIRQVASRPTGVAGPLYVYGPVGTGKTHLLEGLYRSIRRHHPALNTLFLTAEQFTNHFTQAYREHTLPGFRQRFRTVDVLLIDDVDFLDAKRVVQEEFLHTFQQLESHDRLVVACGDRHPRLLTKISDELKTRFLSGMVCRLEAPDPATRETIAFRKAERMHAEFSPEAIKYVALRFSSSVRELEGALCCLQVYQSLVGKRVGIAAARQVLSDLERDCLRVVRLADIERVVCGLFGLDSVQLKSSRRSRSVSEPRMLAMYLARQHTRAAYSEIGAFFGGRNHATVISAERKVADWLERGKSIKIASQSWRTGDLVDTLEQQLLAG